MDAVSVNIRLSSFFRNYRKIFFIEELERNAVLQWMLGAFLLTSLTAFLYWIHSPAITTSVYQANQHICWPYFQGCGEWYFLKTLPFGYSQMILYVALFAILTLAVYFIWKKEWVFAHACALTVWVWKFLMVFVFTSAFSGNFEYYDIILGGVLLFFPYKEYFLKLVFVLFYFLAATIKFDTGWIASLYFTSLEIGMPIFGNTLAPFVTNFVIFLQVVGAWFLLSRNTFLQRLALSGFLAFHLYSGVLVGYRYLLSSIPPLLILFGPLYRPSSHPLDKKSIVGWVFIAALFLFQGMATFISPDRKMTLEGNMYGLYMFEANHQCSSRVIFHYKDGSFSETSSHARNARSRCDPYRYWFPLKETCRREDRIERIEWQFDHSVNGAAFYRIVDTDNACTLTYMPFAHNEWIVTPEKGAALVGYPMKNYFQ